MKRRMLVRIGLSLVLVALGWLASSGGSAADTPFSVQPVDGRVLALAVNGDDVYAGGTFQQPGGVISPGIARWNRATRQWSAVGGGVTGWVSAIVIDGDSIIVGGNFGAGINSDGSEQAARSIARFSAGAWQAFDQGLNGSVYALAVDGGSVLAGGTFTIAESASGPRVLYNVARWENGAWSPLGGGVRGSFPVVRAIAPGGSGPVFGGSFSTVNDGSGQRPAGNIARWTGNGWDLPGALNGPVLALAREGEGIIAGGGFTAATGSSTTPAAGVARWQGDWSAIGQELNGVVRALTLDGNALYAAGMFTAAGDQPAAGIARWNGSAWAPVGESGITDGWGLAARDGVLTLGGNAPADGGTLGYIGTAAMSRFAVVLPSVSIDG